MPRVRVVAVLTMVLALALSACTSHPAPAQPGSTPSAAPAVATGAPSARVVEPTFDQPGAVIQGKAPRFDSRAERDTAFIATVADLGWAVHDGPAYPARFRHAALGDAATICSDARRLRSAGRVQVSATHLASLDQAELIRLSVLFYCPEFSASGPPPASAPVQHRMCPKPSDIVVTSQLTGTATMTDNEFYSTISYSVAYMNLTEYPVWVTPQIKWKSRPIFKGGYPTGDLNRPQGWRPYADPHEQVTTPGRLLRAGEVWRVDALQSGPYVWTAVAARIDPDAFVATDCGYDAG